MRGDAALIGGSKPAFVLKIKRLPGDFEDGHALVVWLPLQHKIKKLRDRLLPRVALVAFDSECSAGDARALRVLHAD